MKLILVVIEMGVDIWLKMERYDYEKDISSEHFLRLLIHVTPKYICTCEDAKDTGQSH